MRLFVSARLILGGKFPRKLLCSVAIKLKRTFVRGWLWRPLENFIVGRSAIDSVICQLRGVNVLNIDWRNLSMVFNTVTENSAETAR